MLYSIVVPVYNSEHTLEPLYSRLKHVFEEELHRDFELILVDDGSKDRSFEIMEKLHKEDPRVRIIQMARNFGQHVLGSRPRGLGVVELVAPGLHGQLRREGGGMGKRE